MYILFMWEQARLWRLGSAWGLQTLWLACYHAVQCKKSHKILTWFCCSNTAKTRKSEFNWLIISNVVKSKEQARSKDCCTILPDQVRKFGRSFFLLMPIFGPYDFTFYWDFIAGFMENFRASLPNWSERLLLHRSRIRIRIRIPVLRTPAAGQSSARCCPDG